MSNFTPIREIGEREQQIFRLLVQQYIDEGNPVGSRTLSKMPGVNVSAASVRNVLGDLEELGLLAAPHTSAGRVPTCLLYTSPSPRDATLSRMPSSA